MTTSPSAPAATAGRLRRTTLFGVALLVLVGWFALGAALAPGASAAPLAATSLPVAHDVSLVGVSLVDVPDTGIDTGTGTADTDEPGVSGPTGPGGPAGAGGGDTVSVELSGLTDKPSTPVVTIIALTLLSVAPAILLTCTSFTKVLIVLGLTRNALGLQQTPPNQVLAGLALFLSLFIMGPVLGDINEAGLQPYLNGDLAAGAAYEEGVAPLREFMLDNTDDGELQLLTNVADRELPQNRDEVSMATLVPAFVLTELKQAFIIGFIIFVPFLVVDIVVSGALMALGMMMMPPTMVSLPFKLLLFVLVDGWGLIIKSLVASYG